MKSQIIYSINQMKEKTLFFGFLFMTIVIHRVYGTVISQQSTNPFCSAPGKSTWAFSQTPAASQLQYDALTYFFDFDKGDSSQLLVRYGDATNNYKFIVFDSNFQNYVTIDAAQSSGTQYKFVGLLNLLLVLQDMSTSDFYAYKFDPAATASTPIQRYLLTIPSSISKPYTKGIIISANYNQDFNYYFMAISDSTKFGIFNIGYESTTPGVNAVGSTISHALGEIYGHNRFVYDVATNSFRNFGTGSWGEFTTFTPVGKIVNCYTFRRSVTMILSVMETTRLTGKLYTVGGDAVPVQITNSDSTTQYMDCWDYLQNFFRAGSAFSHWVTMRPDGGLITSNIPSSELSTTDLMFISLSGNKGVMMYSNKIDYYEHKGDGNVYKYFTKSFTTSDLNIDDSGQWRIGLSCMCDGLSRFSCSSATLNCIVLKKAAKICGAGISDLT